MGIVRRTGNVQDIDVKRAQSMSSPPANIKGEHIAKILRAGS